MKKFFHSFYGKLSLVFLFLLLIMGIVQIGITTRSFTRFIAEVDQNLNLTLAQDMAVELTSLLDEELDFNKIGERIHYMMVMNPKIEIYLLDRAGKILAFFAEPGKTVKAEYVDLAPVHRFLSEPHSLPILGEDPRQPGKKKPFSAASLSMYGKGQGFLYIIIGGERYDSAFGFLRESYIVTTMINGLIITVIFAAIIGLIVFALLTKRLRSISEGVSNFEQGNFSKRVETKYKDEFGQLGKSFNQMAGTIVANMEELKQTDNLRRELVANVSHDLRSPLTSIQGYLETVIMKDATMSREERLQHLNTILSNTQKLNKMVQELFELSKFEANQVKPTSEPFSIAELAQDVVMKFRLLAEEHNIKLSAKINPDTPQVFADIAMIERALSNLIENAINHTPNNGSVALELQRFGERVKLSVSDTGHGIAESDLPHIFDRFYTSRNKKSDSTGLGLAITKQIIKVHNSTLSVKSQVTSGTTFSFDLPVFPLSGVR